MNCKSRVGGKKNLGQPHGRLAEVKEVAGDDRLSRWTHYHRPRVLNGRVRNGNGCGHSGMITGKVLQALVLPAWILPAYVLPAWVLPAYVLPAWVLPAYVLQG